MLSKAVNLIRHNTGVRLTFGFSAIFMVGYILLFYLSTSLLRSSLKNKEENLILTKIDHYVELERDHKFDFLKHVLQEESKEISNLGLLVQITGTDGETKLLITPYNWSEVNTRLEDWTIVPREGVWFSMKRDHFGIEEELILTSQILSNDFVLQVGRSKQERENLIQYFQDVYYRFMIPVFIISVCLGAILAWRSLIPIHDLIKTVRQIRIGDLDARVPVRNPNNELGELSGLFNAMLEKIDTLIKGMKETLDNVAHDLRTPLSRMRANLEMELQRKKADDVSETLVNCVENVDQIEAMLTAISDITKAESGLLELKKEDVKVNEVFEEIMDLYDLVAEDKEISLEKTVPEDLILKADRSRLKQLIANLLDNAIKYSPAKTNIILKAYATDRQVLLEVVDQGIGISQAETNLIFNRLYRSDKSRSQKGMGLGLSIVQAIVHAHQAEIRVKSEVGKGSAFCVSFPG